MTPQDKDKMSTLDVSMVWLGAGISLAEILAGTEFAGLGFGAGMAAIIIGHLIGAVLFLLAGLVSARTGKTAMVAAQGSFGTKGASLFAFLNVVQLLGWIAVLNYDGAIAANGIWGVDTWIWCVIIGVLIALWVGVGLNRIKILSRTAIALLLIMTFAICVFSTVTTNFVAAFSSGISFNTMLKPFGVDPNPTVAGVVVALLAIPASILLPLGDITEFLYLIGSVFAPMAAILVADHFILKSDNTKGPLNLVNLAIWVAGFILYRFLMGLETPVGCTLPCMVAIIIICIVVHRARRARNA